MAWPARRLEPPSHKASEAKWEEETQPMESALNSTLVLVALYICSILHNGHKTIIEFIARLPLETEEKDEGLDP
jgi:hypothetical protein